VLLDSKLGLLNWLVLRSMRGVWVAVVEDITSVLDEELDDALVDA
jgi:hypothetical protein